MSTKKMELYLADKISLDEKNRTRTLHINKFIFKSF